MIRPRVRRPILVPVILMLNLAVFALWMLYDQLWMYENFTISWRGLEEGRYWTVLTAVFSHNMILHFLINMFVLRSFGSIVEEVLGHMAFLRFYLIAGVVSSLAHAGVSAYVMNAPGLPAVGASGAISGLVLIFSLLFPREKILLFGFIPLPAIVGALAFIGLDLWGLWAQAGGGGLPIGHGAHLGGALTGILYYIFVLRRRLIR